MKKTTQINTLLKNKIIKGEFEALHYELCKALKDINTYFMSDKPKQSDFEIINQDNNLKQLLCTFQVILDYWNDYK